MWWWLVVACGGGSADLAEGQCRSAAECEAGLACLPPDYEFGCGTHDSGCEGSGNSCGTGQYCAEVADGCVAAVCRELCADDSGCEADEACDVGSGECTPRSCEQDFDCGTQSVCDPSTGDEHGCARLGCEDDDACEADGFCVGSRCFDAPGTCGSDSPPP